MAERPLLDGLHAMLAGDGDDGVEFGLHLGLRALDLDDEHGRGVAGVAGVGEILADLDRQPIHIFHGDGDDAGPDDGGDGGARLCGGREAEQHRLRTLRPCAGSRTVASVTTPELSLRADDQREQIEPRTVEMVAANVDHRPRRPAPAGRRARYWR